MNATCKFLLILFCLYAEPSTTIASSLPLDDSKTKELANKAILQMNERRGGTHKLLHIGKGRKVVVSTVVRCFQTEVIV